jgi:hypothetical protein
MPTEELSGICGEGDHRAGRLLAGHRTSSFFMSTTPLRLILTSGKKSLGRKMNV